MMAKTDEIITKKQMHQMINVLLHRHFDKNPGAIFFDGVLHALVDSQPDKILQRFLTHNLKPLMVELEKMFSDTNPQYQELMKQVKKYIGIPPSEIIFHVGELICRNLISSKKR